VKAPVPELLDELGQPDWLLPHERVEFQTIERFGDDNLEVKATLVSETRFRVVSGPLSGRILRMFQYTGRKSYLVGVVSELHTMLLTRLRLVLDHPLKVLACRATETDEDLGVFMDAVIERGEISTGPDVREQALGYARSIVAPLIFTGWQDTRWEGNQDLLDTGLRWEGTHGEIKVYTRGPMRGPITSVAITGEIAIAESNIATATIRL
jgi:hypothetical protein